MSLSREFYLEVRGYIGIIRQLEPFIGILFILRLFDAYFMYDIAVTFSTNQVG